MKKQDFFNKKCINVNLDETCLNWTNDDFIMLYSDNEYIAYMLSSNLEYITKEQAESIIDRCRLFFVKEMGASDLNGCYQTLFTINKKQNLQ